jgi:hypothetical protein
VIINELFYNHACFWKVAFWRWWWWHLLLAPQKDCAKTKRKWHRPWCGDDTRALGWGIGMHQAMVWAKAAHHHGASGITFSFATMVIFSTQKVS